MARVKKNFFERLRTCVIYMKSKPLHGHMLTCSTCGSTDVEKIRERNTAGVEGEIMKYNHYSATYRCNSCGALRAEFQSWEAK